MQFGSRRRQHTQLQWFTCGHSSAMNRGFSTHSPSSCSTPNTRSTAVWRLLWWQTAHTAHSLHCFWVSLQRLSVSAEAGGWLFTHGNSIPQQLLAQFSIINTGLSTHSPIACTTCSDGAAGPCTHRPGRALRVEVGTFGWCGGGGCPTDFERKQHREPDHPPHIAQIGSLSRASQTSDT